MATSIRNAPAGRRYRCWFWRHPCGERLGKLPVDVTVVDRKNHHTFQPLLYQVALAVLSPGDIAQPIRSILRDNPNIEVLMDEVVGFDIEARRVHLKSGAELLYDYLIVATGSTHCYFGQRRVGQARARAEDDRRRDRDPPPRAARL